MVLKLCISFRPRNVRTDSQARDMVGSYIYEKMGRNGLVLTTHDFTHEIPIKEFARIKGMYVEVSCYYDAPKEKNVKLA